ncbi:MAG: hypothetical protein JXB05_32820 [Myxococcaceae bacterium]|nr:hypothetical protein [Myxococcaceae bacterium]
MSGDRRHGALKRAEEDLARGEPWLARRRLTSLVVSSPYRAETLSLLGEVCHRMGDLPEAGRFWLLSDAEGEHVERAVRIFTEVHRGTPQQLVAQLPRRTRLASLDAYPPSAQRRIQALGLAAPLAERACVPPGEQQVTVSKSSPAFWGCLLAIFALVAIMVYGLVNGVVSLTQALR